MPDLQPIIHERSASMSLLINALPDIAAVLSYSDRKSEDYGSGGRRTGNENRGLMGLSFDGAKCLRYS